MTGLSTTRLLDDGWTFRQVDAGDIPHSDLTAWQPAVVPGHVHLDLMRLGVIPDPYERMYERAVQWVDDAAWEYRCSFHVEAGELEGARHVLRFGGLDTVATVRLNGAVLATTDNMFIAHEFDVSDALRVGTNDLSVEFASAQRVGEERRAAWLAADGHRAEFERGLLPRTLVRKAQYAWGWDWGPCLRGCGIWQDVSLVRVPVARIGTWSVATTFDDASTECRVQLEVDIEGDAAEVVARLERHGAVVEGSAVVNAGRAAIDLVVVDAARWWPATHGEPALYNVTLSALGGDGDVADTLDARVGLRDIELLRERDDIGESFVFRVNGVDIYAKGANWIPDDLFPARTPPARVHRLLELARDCGMNMVRVWGGGFYESEAFYDACDELGLLVWQDFPYACAPYPDDDDTAAAADAEARSAVRRLRTHASLALWCGNNENQWLIGMGAFGSRKVLGERLYEEVLPRVVAEEDPATPYWPGSPYGTPGPTSVGDDDSSLDERKATGALALAELAAGGHNDETVGDCHYWNVWHGAGDWRHYTSCLARFVSEFGFAAAPALETLTDVLDPDEIGVDTPAMRWHDKTGKGYETYLGYIELHYPRPETADDLVYYSQLNQADAMRFGIEHFRRLRPRNMGTLAWQLNDCWPVQSWAWVDSALRPKAAWYAAKRFYAPLLVSLTNDGDRLQCQIVNDGDAVDGELLVRGLEAKGAVLWESRTTLRVEAGDNVVALDTELPPDVVANAASCIVFATFAGADARLLLVEPKEFDTPRANIDVTGTDNRLTLTSDVLALGVRLSIDGDPDATWSDNFFDLLPGIPRQVQVTSTLPDATARVRVRSL